MTAEDMIQWDNRAEAVARFTGWLTESGIAVPRDFGRRLDAGISHDIFGPVVASNVEHSRVIKVEPELAYNAANTLMRLTARSEVMYRQDREQARGTAPGEAYSSCEFKDARLDLHHNLATGNPVKIPERFAMTAGEGLRQVKAADATLTEAGTEVSRVLANGNYSLYFSNATMLSGAEIPSTSLDDVIESRSEAQMPHLTRSNYIIGQLARHFAAQRQGRLTIIDTGSGTGPTLATIVAGIGEVSDFTGISINSVESNPDFYGVLEDFAIEAMAKIQGLNHDYGFAKGMEAFGSSEDLFSLAHLDIAELAAGLDVLPSGRQDVAVVTANYVWHRLTSGLKNRLVERVDNRTNNSIFLIGDLMQNGSEINRRYFNLGNNGPLNAGNLELRQIFEDNGYTVIKLGLDEAPAGLHPKLLEAVIADADNDGHFWIAYKGDEAQRVLAAA